MAASKRQNASRMRLRKAVGQDAAEQGADAEAEHEGGYDDRDRLDVYPDNHEQQALPGHLIDQRGDSGQKESHRNAGRSYRSFASHSPSFSCWSCLANSGFT
jgi:hypothetical protein